MPTTRLLFGLTLLVGLGCGDDATSDDAAVDAGLFDAGDAASSDAGARCDDGLQNGDESDTDCGGSCTPCFLDDDCRADADCQSEICGASGRCLNADCGNSIADGSESDVDCGGGCDLCTVGAACARDTDCDSGTCGGSVCLDASCRDGLRGGDESDVDCGGSCVPCAAGGRCDEDADCTSEVCRGLQRCADACFATWSVSCPEVPVTYLKGNAESPAGYFGRALALDGDLLAVGADGEDEGGAVHVFVRTETGVWTLEAVVVPNRPYTGAAFGTSLDLEGDTLVVGAPRENSAGQGVNTDELGAGGGSDSGAVYIFRRTGSGVWTQEAHIKSAHAQPEERFGNDVSLSGDWLAIGCVDDTSVAEEAGAAYVYSRRSGTWALEMSANASDAGDHLGQALTIWGDLLLVGAPNEDGDGRGLDGDPSSNARGGSGAVFVYRRSGETWTREAYIKAPNADGSDGFGGALAFDGEVLVVCALEEDSAALGVDGDASDNSASEAGAAYVFRRASDGTWSFEAYLKASNTFETDNFGAAVAVQGDRIAVGAFREDTQDSGLGAEQTGRAAGDTGAVYVFARTTAGWREGLFAKAIVTSAGDFYGRALTLDERVLVVGAYREDGASSGVGGDPSALGVTDSGAVYVYEFAIPVTEEVCDGVDNDADGTVDEAFAECPSACVAGLCS